jgi:beta-phosphoglucomutase-like phosphatase (HAD superfamily)
LDPGRCWVLEDSIQGLESAVSAGALVVHLTARGADCGSQHRPTMGCVATIEAFLGLAGLDVAA